MKKSLLTSFIPVFYQNIFRQESKIQLEKNGPQGPIQGERVKLGEWKEKKEGKTANLVPNFFNYGVLSFKKHLFEKKWNIRVIL